MWCTELLQKEGYFTSREKPYPLVDYMILHSKHCHVATTFMCAKQGQYSSST